MKALFVALLMVFSFVAVAGEGGAVAPCEPDAIVIQGEGGARTGTAFNPCKPLDF